MSNAAFYSRHQQCYREWRALWKSHGTDTLLGGLYVLAGFYADTAFESPAVRPVFFSKDTAYP